MSPAMVDFRTPAAASPQIKSNRLPSRNPRKGQIPSSPSPYPSPSPSLSDQVGIPSSGLASMDRNNLGHGIHGAWNSNEGSFPSGFPPPFPSHSFPPSTFPSVSASGKPAPAAGLTKPRLFKVRKHLAAPRVKQAAVPETGAGSGFNPFRSDPSVEEGGSGVLREQLYSSNPFAPEVGAQVPQNSSNVNSGSFESGKPENAGFVFGSGSGSGSGLNSKNVGSGISFSSEGCRNLDAGGFVFGSGGRTSSILSGNSSGNLGGTNLGSSESVNSENVEFVFGGSSQSGSSSNNIGMGELPGCSFSSVSEGSENLDTGGFVFGSGVNDSTSCKKPSFGSSVSSFSMLPDEMRKLNLGYAGNGDGFVKTTNADTSTSVNDNGTFVFGGSKAKSDSGAFVFGSDVKKSGNLSQSSSFGSDVGSVSKLPDEMRKLNIKNAGDGDGFEKTKHADNTAKINENNTFIFESSSVKKLPEEAKKFDSSAFVFGRGAKKSNNFSQNLSFGLDEGSFSKSKNLPEEMRNSFSSAFVFGSDLKKNTNRNQNSSLGSDEGSFSNLPDEMRKLNLENAGNGDGFEKTKHTDNRSNVDENNSFVFRSNSVKNLPEEMKKLNIRSRPEIQTNKSESSDFVAGVFVFGSSAKSSSQTSATPFSGVDDSMASELPDGKQKLNTEGFEKVKETSCSEKVDVSNGFVLGSSGSISGSFGGNTVNMLHDGMEKLNIGCKTENLAGSIPLKFAFQGGEQDHNSSMSAIPPSQTHDHFRPTTTAGSSFHSSPPQYNFQSVETEFIFRGHHEGLETPDMEFRTPNKDASRLAAENLFTRMHQNKTFSTKKGEVKGIRIKRRGKSRQFASVHQNFCKQFDSVEKGSQENPELDPAGGYSPMDYSPYQENLVADQYSRETSVASDESIQFSSRGASTDTRKSFSVDEREDLVSAAERLVINEDNLTYRDLHDHGSKDHVQGSFAAEISSAVEQTYGFGKDSHMPNYEDVHHDSVTGTVPMEAEVGTFKLNSDRQASEGRPGFRFASTSPVEDFGESNFTFTASPSVQGPVTASKRNYRRKSRTKAGQDSCHSISNAKDPLSSPLPNFTSLSACFDPAQGQKCTSSVPQTAGDGGAGKSKESDASQESRISAAASVAAREACEKWRLRGNKAYENGHLSKAEDYYTHGVNSISLKEISRSCNRPLMLCYSNRAATRMSLGRMREALSDCKMAVAIDPSFLRAQVRAANCHLALGEIGDALKTFKKCLQSENDISPDQKILIDASDGLQKAQQVADLTGQAAELLLKGTSKDSAKALQFLSEALTISQHSESLLEMKAEALLMVRSYEEVIQLCEQTLDLAEKNSVETEADAPCKDVDNSECVKISLPRLWRWRLISKSYFYLGRLEEALELLRKHEKLKPVVDKYDNKSSESSTSFAVTVQELLRLKTAGNEAFQAGRHSEALECYTAALACNTESRPFAAICFCNRAAQYQALGQITDAIADCSLAIALDASYPKAISRRATLHEMIRDYGQAANDIHRLISVLEKQLRDNQCGALGKSMGSSSDLKRARLRLSNVEEEARKGTSLDMYKILGIEPTCSASDVKKAYRKAALRHHPDKAGQFLARSENVDDGLWREVANEVHMDADRLFKMIGEAYTILSDPAKRQQYDAEEEMRTTLMKAYNGSSTPKSPADRYSSQYERSANRRHWRAHGSSHQRW